MNKIISITWDWFPKDNEEQLKLLYPIVLKTEDKIPQITIGINNDLTKNIIIENDEEEGEYLLWLA